MLKVMSLVFGIMLSSMVLAHDGDHAPPTVKPIILGARVLGNETMLVEFIYDEKVIKLYPFDLKQKALDLAKTKLKVKVQLPQNKVVDLAMTAHGDHFMANFERGNAHRITVLVSLPDDYVDTLKFTSEKKK